MGEQIDPGWLFRVIANRRGDPGNPAKEAMNSPVSGSLTLAR